MEKIGNILLKYLKDHGLYSRVLEYESVKIYNREILEKYPQLKPSHASDIYEGTIKISVPDSVLNYEVFLKKHEIIESINRILGKKIVKDLIVRIEG